MFIFGIVNAAKDAEMEEGQMTEAKFRIADGELQIEFAGSEEFVLSQIKNLPALLQMRSGGQPEKQKYHRPRTQKTHEDEGATKRRQSEAGNIKDFWDSKDPKSNYEKLAVLGYFIQFVNKKRPFTRENLAELWDQFEVPPTANAYRVVVQDTIGKYKYLRSKKRGEYEVAQRGQRLVEKLPNADKKDRGPAPTARAKKLKRGRKQK